MNIVLQKTNALLLIIGFVFIIFAVSFQTASAQVTLEDAELSGYAWSSNVGWISLNCRNNNSCASDGGVDYAVTVNASNRLIGHAWSSNIGWIQFGGLSGFPTTGGNGGGQARLISGGSNLLMDGWARAVTYGPGDGWISLKGTTPNYRVEFGGAYNVVGNVGNNSNQTAWAPDDIGWIDFNTPYSRVSIELDPAIDIFTADEYIVPLGSSTNLNWTIQGFETCTASNDQGQSDWNGSVASGNGTHSRVITPVYGVTTYSLTCVDTFLPSTLTPEPVVVEARPDIQIDSFSLRPVGTWSVQPDGSWNNVRFQTDVTGLPNGETVSYRLLYTNSTQGTSQTIVGTVRGTATGVSFSPALEIDGYEYGTSTIELQVDLDASGNPPGTIAENIPSSGVNENIDGNTSILTDIFTAPQEPTTFSIDAPDDLIRYGETTTVDWQVITPYVLNCTVSGPGVTSITFDTNVPLATPPPDDESGNVNTSSLTSSGTYTVICIEPLTRTTFTTTKQIEVIPKFEEV